MLFKKTQLGWRLIIASLRCCYQHPKLLIYPLLARSFFLIIVGAISYFLWKIRSGVINYNLLTASEVVWIYVGIALTLWIGNLIGFYFNVAFIAGLKQIEQQQKLSIKENLQQALGRFWVIFCWILIHFTLGFAFSLFHQKMLQSKKINHLLSGLAWGWASFLILPLLIHKPAGFFATLERSSQITRAYAGDKPKLKYRYALLSYSLRFLSVIPMFIGFQSPQVIWTVLGLVGSLLLFLTTMVIFNVFFVCVVEALYQYIVHNKTLHPFHKKDLAAAIAPGFSTKAV